MVMNLIHVENDSCCTLEKKGKVLCVIPTSSSTNKWRHKGLLIKLTVSSLDCESVSGKENNEAVVMGIKTPPPKK